MHHLDAGRRYRWRWIDLTVRAGYPLIAVAYAGLIVAAIDDQATSWPVVAIFGVAVSLIVLWVERVGTRIGVYERTDGLFCRTAVGSYLLPWASVDGFEAEHVLTHRYVYARRRSGGRVRLPVAQGANVVWHDGATRDIVGVLNERLKPHQDMDADATS
jgi:hypothetical protein